MHPLILVINAGSSSIKFQLFSGEHCETLFTGLIEAVGTERTQLRYKTSEQQYEEKLGYLDFQQALAQVFLVYAQCVPADGRLCAVGHRVVHGGEWFTKPTVVTDDVLKQIERCTVLAPLHNPSNLLGIISAQKAFPTVPQVAVFDTAFHQTLPDYAYLYALPEQYYQDYGVRRYGFHGISYQYLVQRSAKILAVAENKLSLICAHLGNGCSVCAVRAGKSVDVSMGCTPLEGLIMGTRSGDIDPGLFVYLAEQLSCSIDEINNLLTTKSGLLGISALSQDMRVLHDAAQSGDLKACLAIEMFCYRLAKYIAAFMVPLGRIDALVFSGGIGEHAAFIREKTLARLAFLGFVLDPAANARNGVGYQNRITTETSTCALVIATQEELMIAEAALQLVQQGEGQ